jgi:hypothetical protein
VGNDLAIGLRVEYVFRGERRPNLAMVVDLAIDHGAYSAAGNLDGLPAAVDVDNRKALEDKADVLPQHELGIVGTAVPHGVAHRPENQIVAALCKGSAVKLHVPGDTAHVSSP